MEPLVRSDFTERIAEGRFKHNFSGPPNNSPPKLCLEWALLRW